jgi:hypothetical protein
MAMRRGLTRIYAVVIIVVLGLVGSMVFISAWMGALEVGLPMGGPEKDELLIEKVSVNNIDPFVLTVDMKSLYYLDIEFDRGYVQDGNQTVVAQCLRNVPYGSVSDGRGHSVQHFIVCILPANSEKTVTLNFNTTLPPGNYRLTLQTSFGYSLYSDYFTIP